MLLCADTRRHTDAQHRRTHLVLLVYYVLVYYVLEYAQHRRTHLVIRIPSFCA